VSTVDVGDEVYVIDTTYQVITNKSALVEMSPGCVWLPLTIEGQRRGIAFIGDSRFAVDAIAETDDGAVGKSVSGMLKGIQVYLGQSDPTGISRPASDDEIRRVGHENKQVLVVAVKSDLENRFKHTQIKQTDKEGDVFFGYDSNDTTILLVCKADNLVFTHGKDVHVIGHEGSFNVDGRKVEIGNRHGRRLILTHDSTRDLEGLEDLGAFIDETVSGALDMAGLCWGRQGRRHHHRHHHEWQTGCEEGLRDPDEDRDRCC